MNQAEYELLHTRCTKVMETYLTEARKTSVMLGTCTPGPLPFEHRFALLSQEIVEKDAHCMYLDAKRLLHSAALLGFGAIGLDASPAAALAIVKG